VTKLEPARHVSVFPARRPSREDSIMAEKFDPAPFDKHAADPKEAARADEQMHEHLKNGLVGTFPASDPVSAAQPAKTRHDDPPPSLRTKIVSAFR
jgi:hypothetical protein